MTVKRFKIICDDNIEFIMQTKLLLPIYDDKERLSLKTCCDLLNDLHDENEQLKLQMLNMEEDRDYFKSKANSLEEGYIKLQDKEIRLKEELDYWKKRALLLEYKYGERNKINVEGIIGLVKTDESTDSVELKKELYK